LLEFSLEAWVTAKIDIKPAYTIEADDTVKLFFLLKGLNETFDVFDGSVIGIRPEVDKLNLKNIVPGAFPKTGENSYVVPGPGTGKSDPAHIPLEPPKLKISFNDKC